MLRGGMGIYALSHHLGHGSVSVTEVYLQFLSGQQVQRAKASETDLRASLAAPCAFRCQCLRRAPDASGRAVVQTKIADMATDSESIPPCSYTRM
jgi:hypothetical protein